MASPAEIVELGARDDPDATGTGSAAPGPGDEPGAGAEAPDRRSHPDLWRALRDVRDPEVPVSLVDLGLIYAVRRDDGHVEVDLSFTATACPAMDFIQDDIRDRLLQEPGVEVVETRVVWSPPWTPDRISDEGREALRRFGISL